MWFIHHFAAILAHNVAEVKLKPISEYIPDGRSVLGFFPNRDERHTYAVVYFDESAGLWFLASGGRFVGEPSHFAELFERDENGQASGRSK